MFTQANRRSLKQTKNLMNKFINEKVFLRAKRGRTLNKKGQVTIFIILGILLLIAIALVIVFTREATVFRPERVIPPEVSPVIAYGDNCLEEVLVDGLNLMGLQGGYIYLPSEIENNPLAFVDIGLKIPYWQWGTNNRIPSLGLMEAHLNRYMEEHLNDCLEDFAPFSEQFDFIQKADIVAETTIGDDKVLVILNYPFDIVNKGGTKITDLDYFQADVPIKLKKVYQAAKEIMETEAEEQKLEKTTIDLISLDPEVPISGVDFQCGQKIWQVDAVENKLKTLLRTNLPKLRVDKTEYLKVPESQPYIKNHFIWEVTDLNYKGIGATFQFSENHPFSMSVSPRQGNLLKSGMQKGQDLASFVCIQMWKFTYDVQYPVIVTVEDIENNYAFNFAFDVVVKRNRPARDELSGMPPQSFVQFDESAEAYCAEENRYGNYNMKIFTRDNVSDPVYGDSSWPINKVNITFTCLKYTCPMGQTEYQQGGAISVLDARFPYCVNGVLRGHKEGYVTAEQFVTTVPGQEVTLYLKPLQMIEKYSVVKHRLVNGELLPGENLEAEESAFINIVYTHNKTNLHSTYGVYPAATDSELQPLELMGGADYPYTLEIFLMDEENVIGGYQGTWTPAWSELKNSNEIVFHVVEVGKPLTEAATISLFSSIQTYSAQMNHVIR